MHEGSGRGESGKVGGVHEGRWGVRVGSCAHGLELMTLQTEAMVLKQSVVFSSVREGFCSGDGGGGGGGGGVEGGRKGGERKGEGGWEGRKREGGKWRHVRASTCTSILVTCPDLGAAQHYSES